MRIACPACSAAYDVPDRLLAGGARTLRCSRCGADFPLPRVDAPAREDVPKAPTAPVPEAPTTPVPEPEPSPAPPAVLRPEPEPPPLRVPERPLVPADSRPSPSLARAWVASLALVIGAVLALLVFRGKVMEAWPPAARLFAALGLA